MAEEGLPKNTCYSHDGKPSGSPHRSGFQIPLSTNNTAAAKTLDGVVVLIVTVLFINFILAITFTVSFVPPSPDVNLISPSVAAHNACSHHVDFDDGVVVVKNNARKGMYVNFDVGVVVKNNARKGMYVNFDVGVVVKNNARKGMYVNFDVGVVVKNNARKGMLLKNITVWTYHGNDVLGAPVTLPSFELQRHEGHTAGFKHKDLLIPIDEWESTAVGVSWVGFVVRFKIWYRGMAFSRKIAVKADCGTVKMRFNPAGTSSNATTLIENFDTTTCFVVGLWDYLLDGFNIYMFCSNLAILIIGVLLERSRRL